MNYIKEKYNNLKKSRFISDVAILAGGATIAQVITIVFSPLITRIYGPEAFGILGVFVAMAALITPVASLAYTVAIAIPTSDNHARSIVSLSIFIAIIIALLLTAVLGLFHHRIALSFGFHTSSLYLLLLPILVLLTAAEQALSQWLIRKKQFRSISIARVIHTSALNLSKTGIGLIMATAPALIFINTIGQAFHILLLWIRAKSSFLNEHSQKYVLNQEEKSSIKTVAYRYRDYPTHRAPQLLIYNASQNIPVLLLAAFFGPAPAGFYTLTRRVLKLPSTLISISVGKVFLPRIAEAARRGLSLRPLIVKTTIGLVLVGLLPYGIVFVFGPAIFGFVFGPDWVTAGDYARWLALWLYFLFINEPSIQAIPLLGLQGQHLLYEIIVISVSTGSLAYGAIILKSSISAITLYSLSGVILNLALLIYVLINSKNRLREGL